METMQITDEQRAKVREIIGRGLVTGVTSIFRCHCGLLLFKDSPCAECARFYGASRRVMAPDGNPESPRTRSSTPTLAAILLLLGFIYIANSIAQAPAREDVMQEMEPSEQH